MLNSEKPVRNYRKSIRRREETRYDLRSYVAECEFRNEKAPPYNPAKKRKRVSSEL